MVDLEIRSRNLSLSPALREHVARKVDYAVRRLAHHVDRVVVRIVDVNGPKGGEDKRARVIAHLSGGADVVVEATGADAYGAVSRSVARLDEAVARSVERGRRRGPHTIRRDLPSDVPSEVPEDDDLGGDAA